MSGSLDKVERPFVIIAVKVRMKAQMGEMSSSSSLSRSTGMPTHVAGCNTDMFELFLNLILSSSEIAHSSSHFHCK
jgi:hypothetical protein